MFICRSVSPKKENTPGKTATVRVGQHLCLVTENFTQNISCRHEKLSGIVRTPIQYATLHAGQSRRDNWLSSSARRDNWQEKLAKVNKNGKEEGAAGEEHKQSAMERLGQTVKRHFEHSDHSNFLSLHGKLVVHSKRALNSHIFPPWIAFSTQSFHGAVLRLRLFRSRSLRSLTLDRWTFYSNRSNRIQPCLSLGK